MSERKGRGQPTKMTPETLKKLDDAFSFCFSDEEAALYAGITARTLYNFQNKNPKYLQRKQRLRLTPNLAAKTELVKGIKNSIDQARWWADHKMSDEFAIKTKVEHSGKIETEDKTDNKEVIALGQEYSARLRALFATPLPAVEDKDSRVE